MEPHHERLKKRIVSKKGNINIGKTKVSQRFVRFFLTVLIELNTNSPRISKVHRGGRSLQIEWMKKLLNNHETLCYLVLKPLFNICAIKTGYNPCHDTTSEINFQERHAESPPSHLMTLLDACVLIFDLLSHLVTLDKLVCFDLRPLSRDRDWGRRRWGIRRPRTRWRASQRLMLTATIISGKLSKRKLQFLDKL